MNVLALFSFCLMALFSSGPETGTRCLTRAYEELRTDAVEQGRVVSLEMLSTRGREPPDSIDFGVWMPGPGQAGSFDLQDFGTHYEDAVIVLTGVSNSGSIGYEYYATAAPTIPPVTDLACDASADDIVLRWAPRPGAVSYALYIAQSAHFVPDEITSVSVQGTTYMHPDAVEPGNEWFYVVRGQNELMQSLDSNRVGAWVEEHLIP